jgi:iron complex outermembrane receptor protein
MCFASAQSLLTGTILNESGDPLPGATVEIVNLNLATSTDAYGFFKFPGVYEGKHTLRVNYIGYAIYERKFEMSSGTSLDVALTEDVAILQAVEVNSLRVEQKDPFSFSDLNKEDIKRNNFGQDIPYLLRNTPSVVATSDAGAGIGYTGVRVRGSDATRTNVVINDVPLNDSESQATFWVNLPDLASSTNSIQLQRGVGASTNGAGAFGATLGIETKGYEEDAYVELINTFGSFDTRRHTLNLNSGRLDNNLVFEGRLSLINSDGYIDRATSDLKSAYLSAGYFGDDFSVQGFAMLGSEVTYQSWYGAPESRVKGDLEELQNHYDRNVGTIYNTVEDSINLFNSDRRYNYYLYDNQVDDYNQNHFQLHLNKQHKNNVSTQLVLHYTQGSGFFEEFRFQNAFADYGFADPVVDGATVSFSDLVRRRWLDNDFYGVVGSVNFGNSVTDVKIGGAFHRYEGDHFGEIINSDLGELDFIGANYYFGESTKDDGNIYTKVNYKLNDNLEVYGDLQLRRIDYKTKGTDNDLVNYDIDENFTFFNPKFGITYSLDQDQILYTSIGVANKEPSRSDFIDALTNEVPQHETLYDLEAGYKKLVGDFTLNANLYYMLYENQLIPTGELNDVGSVIRMNVDESFRAGIEIDGTYKMNSKLYVGFNAAFSQNKIKNFDEVVYDYTNGFDIIFNNFTDTDISFSPNVIAGLQLVALPAKGLEVGLYPKYISRQFLDNTSNVDRSIDDYLVTDLIASYQLEIKKLKEVSLNLKVNNLFDVEYSANGYTYNYIFEDLVVENFLYPQAGINFLAGLTVRF